MPKYSARVFFFRGVTWLKGMSPLFHHAFAELLEDAFWEMRSIQYNSCKVQLKRYFSRTQTLVPAWNSSGGK